MEKNISPNIIEKWLKGWTLSRELPLPIKYKSGFKVDVVSKSKEPVIFFLSLMMISFSYQNP